MKAKFLFLVVCFAGSLFRLSAQNIDDLKVINSEVWNKFYQAFDSLDYQLMAKIHSKELVRVPADQKKILDYNTYIANYKSGFQKAKENGITQSIFLRFFERLCNGSTASETGIYKFFLNKGTPKEQIYYGRFHVVLKKEGDHWKITVDYDSNKNNSIGEEDYQKAYAIDDFEKYK